MHPEDPPSPLPSPEPIAPSMGAKENLKAVFEQHLREARRRALKKWILGDFAYAVLPILIAISFVLLRHPDWRQILHFKEWAFAAIILSGACIREIVRLRTVNQSSIDEEDLDARLGIYIILIVASAVTLTLQEVSGTNAPSNFSVDILQIALFSLSALLLLRIYFLMEEFAGNRNKSPLKPTPRDISRHILIRLEDARNTVAYSMVKSYDLPLINDEDFDIPDKTVPGFVDRLELLLKEIERDTQDLRSRFVRRAPPHK